mgnify:CR=1 FL=1
MNGKNKKKFLLAILLIVLLVALIANVNAADDTQMNSPLMQVEIIHEASSASSVSEYGFIEIPYVAPSVTEALAHNGVEAFQTEELPDKHDARNGGYVTSAKNQMNLGTCWAFAALSAAESSLIKNKGWDVDTVDLAEAQLAYFAYRNPPDTLGMLESHITTSNYYQAGGNPVMTVPILAKWSGAVDENE